jgi:5-dehydro-2-deoxygluconokinase
MSATGYDLLTLGRVSMDLFSLDIGKPFVEISGFSAHVGGSPTNIAVAGSRLGLRTALLSAVGEDMVGDFVIKTLDREGVETHFITRKVNSRTGLAVLGIEPPDKFPLVFYRENAADLQLTIDDVQKAPIAQSRALLLSGTALSRGSCREATLFAAEVAHRHDVPVFMDLDLRVDQWTHARAYGLHIRAILPAIDVLIGTEEEFWAAFMPDPGAVWHGHAVPEDEIEMLQKQVRDWAAMMGKTAVLKRGALGVTVFTGQGESLNVPGFRVKIVNTVGAGDAFAGGLIYGRLQGWNWMQSGRIANANGALVVTRHGCAAAMPYEQEVLDFVANC